MRILVTGAAGFIGSHTCRALLLGGHDVVGVDALTPYYERSQKEANVTAVTAAVDGGTFEMVAANLATADLAPLLDGIDSVIHLAAQPGVRLSWSDRFVDYSTHNILATQRLLEAVKAHPVDRLVYSSSSSVYGEVDRFPVLETDLPRPHSPYGVTKLAAEHLCNLYARNWGIPTVSLRYFTVYGPRQRPDMAFHRLCEAAVTGEPFPLFGSGEQIRDFTYVADVVAANLAALTADVEPGFVANVAGGGATSMNEVIDMVEALAGHPVPVERRPAQAGDVTRTGGSGDLARSRLGWDPAFSVEEGLAAQLRWHQERAAT